MKKVALIGFGKTGSHVGKLLTRSESLTVFNSKRKPTVESLKEHDVAILFVPADAADELAGIVLESMIPAVWGTTGFDWPDNLQERAKVYGCRWVIASNFSLGMNLVRRCLELIGQGRELLDNPTCLIHEVHHKDKKDAPSGTALAWERWLGIPGAQISSSREGDVKGIHSLQIKTAFESIQIKHEAHDRAVFARGAVWAARFLLENPDLLPGVYSFESIVDRTFFQ